MLKWPENVIRRASVNSFGYGGTNAHVIVEAVGDYLDNIKHISSLNIRTCEGEVNGKLPHEVAEVTGTRSESTRNITKSRLFPLSHNQEGGIAKLAANFKRFISDNLDNTDESLDSFALTLSDRRSFLTFRSCVAASTRDELLDRLENIATGSDRAQKYNEQPKLCFAFTGMALTTRYAILHA